MDTSFVQNLTTIYIIATVASVLLLIWFIVSMNSAVKNLRRISKILFESFSVCHRCGHVGVGYKTHNNGLYYSVACPGCGLESQKGTYRKSARKNWENFYFINK